MKLPYEVLPLPAKGDPIACCNRQGEEVHRGTVVSVTEPWKDKTYVVHVSVPRDLVMEIRAVKVVA
jgi:hypothetical protein